MSDFYNRLQNTALRLIESNGLPCIITSLGTSGGFDAETGMPLDDIAGSTQTAQCVVLNYADVITNMPESLVQQGDKKLLIAAKGVTMPMIGSTVAVGDNAYTVVAVKDVKPADVALTFEIHGRE